MIEGGRRRGKGGRGEDLGEGMDGESRRVMGKTGKRGRGREKVEFKGRRWRRLEERCQKLAQHALISIPLCTEQDDLFIHLD